MLILRTDHRLPTILSQRVDSHVFRNCGSSAVQFNQQLGSTYNAVIMESTPAPQGSSSTTCDRAATDDRRDSEWDEAYSKSRHGRFRFKRRSRRSEDPDDDRHRHRRRHRDGDEHDHHRHHHRRKKRRKKSRDEDEGTKEPDNDPYMPPPLSPNTAFRESLFDALADDEGAAFWEAVYGQPIHTYAKEISEEDGRGPLERMTDEEYAAYVRARMWERTHEGMMEAREKQRGEREKEQARQRAAEAAERERRAFERAVEESLRRGEERRRRKMWARVWEEYLRAWEELNAAAQRGATGENALSFRKHAFWPVQSGKRRDITRDAVREFMQHAPGVNDDSTSSSSSLVSVLKTERVRWHPDKMVHRYGALGLAGDKDLIRSVTEVFQIVDHMWNEEKDKAGKAR